MATMALQQRLLPVLRAVAPLARPSPLRAFSTTIARLDNGSGPLPKLPPRKEVDPLAKAAKPKRPAHPYDATKSSIADLIGASMTTSFSTPELGPKAAPLPIRAAPSTGRTVHVSGGINVARAFTVVNQRVNQNKIASIASRQRFHERNGLKKKRLRRSRWRARFKTGFHATVTRVQSLVRQGW